MADIPIVIILLTYVRTEYALLTIAAMLEHLRHDARAWYVADDGSPREHVEAVCNALRDECVIGMHSERLGYGASANRAWEASRRESPLTLWLEDDWELLEDFDPQPYIDLLLADKTVGMIRLGYLQEGLITVPRVYGGRAYLDIDLRSVAQAFTGHPSLRHWRARERWGEYPTGHNPGDTEVLYSMAVRRRGGAKILYPHTIKPWGLFGHIGTVPSYTIEGAVTA